MKALGWIIGLLALLIIAFGIFLFTGSGALLEAAIERYGSQYLGAPVDVAEAEVSITDGRAAIRGLVIENPPGFTGPPAFRLNDIGMTLNTDQLSSEIISLREVTIDGASVAALVKGRESNLQKLMDHLNAQLGPEQEPAAEESEVKLIIDKLDFTNAAASVDSDVLGQAEVSIPDVHLTDIGRASNGATIAEVLKQVLEPVVRSVTRALLEQGVDLEGVRERVQGERERLEESLRERADEAVPGGLDRLRDTIRSRRGDSEQQDEQ